MAALRNRWGSRNRYDGCPLALECEEKPKRGCWIGSRGFIPSVIRHAQEPFPFCSYIFAWFVNFKLFVQPLLWNEGYLSQTLSGAKKSYERSSMSLKILKKKWLYPLNGINPFQTRTGWNLVHVWPCITSQLTQVHNSSSNVSCRPVLFSFVHLSYKCTYIRQ